MLRLIFSVAICFYAFQSIAGDNPNSNSNSNSGSYGYGVGIGIVIIPEGDMPSGVTIEELRGKRDYKSKMYYELYQGVIYKWDPAQQKWLYLRGQRSAPLAVPPTPPSME